MNGFFSFKGLKLKPTLPLKYANDESMNVFKIAAIENKEYGYVWDFVTKPIISENKFGFGPKQIIFYYDNEKYNDFKKYLNGDFLNSTYVFNKSNMTLIDTPTEPFTGDGSDGIYRYQCQKWIKQKWYQFP